MTSYRFTLYTAWTSVSSSTTVSKGHRIVASAVFSRLSRARAGRFARPATEPPRQPPRRQSPPSCGQPPRPLAPDRPAERFGGAEGAQGHPERALPVRRRPGQPGRRRVPEVILSRAPCWRRLEDSALVVPSRRLVRRRELRWPRSQGAPRGSRPLRRRCRRIQSITAGSWISAITRISPPQRGQTIGSTSYTSRMSSA